MTKKLILFNLFGFKVSLHASWLFLAFLVAWSLAMGYFPRVEEDLTTAQYWIMSVIGVVGLLISIVIHEFFHSLVARHYKLPIKGITLFIFGGVAEMGDHPTTPKAEGLMAIVGPIASLMLWIAFGVVVEIGLRFGWPGPVLAILLYLSQINFILAAFNMVPAFPLDGGRVLRSILWAIKGDILWATKWAQRAGTFFAFLIIGIGIMGLLNGIIISSLWWILIGLFINFASKASRVQVLVHEMLKTEPISRFIDTSPHVVDPDEKVDSVVENFFYRYRERLFPVLSGEKVEGCVGIRDIQHVDLEKRPETRVEDIMKPCSEETTIQTNESAYDAFKKMIQGRFKELLVINEGKLIGVIKFKDIVEFLNVKLELEEGSYADFGGPGL